MKIIKGKKIAENILNDLKEKIKLLKKKPCLAVVLVGDDKASQIYIKLKELASKKIGIEFKKFLFDKKEREKEIIKKIKELNKNKRVTGIIVQLPLPKKLNKNLIINAVSPKKDVDGFHIKNQNLFLENKKSVEPVFPKAIVKMINVARDGDNLKAIIVCRSEIFGRIMKKTLEKNEIQAEFIFCKDLIDNNKNNKYAHIILKRADIVISACGTPGLIKGEAVKNNAIIIDGGITKKNKIVLGDVDINSFKNTDCKITPVPGGVGPVTVATLLENVYLTSKKTDF